MADLRPDDFGEFFQAVHGCEPFPWQRRLLQEVAAKGRWPALLDLPTSSGKTAAIDVALFHLALEATSPARNAPVRVIYVVDRRTIVDQAHARAEKIRLALAGGDGVLGAIRDRMQSLAGDGEPALHVTVLRGGIPRDDDWVRTPSQPLVAISTVDQVGSRLLFRGYGVTPSMQPIHAGLLGNDALFLLDEVHLSRPFFQLLEALRTRYATTALPSRWQVVRMSATPGADDEEEKPFTLDGDDRKHPVLQRRLRASKPVTLAKEVKVSGNEDDRCRKLAAEIAREVRSRVAPGKSLAAIVNRVATARFAAAALRESLGERTEVVLLTGRMRPLDRDDVVRGVEDRVLAGRKRVPDARPLVVVATQCIEAGADYDFDVVVTECASLDALRQRFGRLNRLGDIETCEGVVIARADTLEDDPIYGPALGATWAWLGRQKSLDFGLEALERPLRGLAELLAPEPEAPLLLPSHLDAWAQTAPHPTPDPEVAPWLHGFQRETPEVRIVWRADFPDMVEKSIEEELKARLEACPPGVGEALAVPLYAARAWLEGREAPPVADVEGTRPPEESDDHAGTFVVAWRGDETRVVPPGEILPGDTIVVPSSLGGIADGNWDPRSRGPVLDLGLRANLEMRRQLVVRTHPGVLKQMGIEAPAIESDDDPRQTADEILDLLVQKDFVARPGKTRVVVFGTGDLAILGKRKKRGGGTTEENQGSFTGVTVTLASHLKGVGERARDYARACGLSAELVSDLHLAGSWHDAGKADRRFQKLLLGGSEFRLLVTEEPLAKSVVPAADRSARERARELAGWPRGYRHELVSIALMRVAKSWRESAHDSDLVLHLVESHHGHCRPLSPAVPDGAPVEVSFNAGGQKVVSSSDHGLARIDSGVSERFWRLVRRYGWHGLAWLEAILRLADHRQSEWERAQKDEEVEV